MANAADRKSVIAENLGDIGLNEEDTEKCIGMLRDDDLPALEKFLGSYRRSLLESVHECEKRISCLDYLTYNIRKNGGISS
ncbi:MAG: hypothetical protein IKQ90_05230 [Ruminococcus sp.]|nr:hypothetical protein [Ruminococcus sp.]